MAADIISESHMDVCLEVEAPNTYTPFLQKYQPQIWLRFWI